LKIEMKPAGGAAKPVVVTRNLLIGNNAK